jgi:hypothetical protein
MQRRRFRFKARYRLARRRVRYLFNSLSNFRIHMGGFFHWKYSGALIFSLYGLAVAMVGIGLAVDPFHRYFILADCFFAGSLVWAIGWWLSSEPLARKKPKLTKKQKKRNIQVSYVSYRAWKWGVILLMIVAFGGSLKLASEIELDRELSLHGGLLVPANDPTPPSACSGDDSLFLVNFGPWSAGTRHFPNIVFSSANIPRMTLEKNRHGELAVTTDIYDENENILVSIEKNHFIVTNDAFEITHPDRSTLVVVVKHQKEKVLDIRFLNKRAIRIWGHFRYPNAPDLVASQEELRLGNLRLAGSGNCATDPGPGLPDFAF